LRLDADDPLIRLRAEIELLPEPAPQSVYFGFSLALDAGWEAAFDSAGISIKLDEDQLPGSCRNWVTAENYAAMWDGLGGVALFVDEAPMVQIGGFNFRAPMDRVERGKNPTLLAWPVSNYWDTNFPRIQPGRMVFNYGLSGIATPDLAEIGRRARAFRMPGLFWPVTTHGREVGQGVIDPSNPQS
jgi:alpha-mannosidase